MSKSSKSKKNRVPKISEAEYVEYVNSLKSTGQVCVGASQKPFSTEKMKSE